MKRLLCSSCLSLILVLTACSNKTDHSQHNATTMEEKQHQQHEMTTDQLTLQFTANPTQPKPQQQVTLTATVTAGKKPTTDAKVELEVWREGEKQHEMLLAKQQQDGVYQAMTTPQQAGTHLVIVHVTTSATHQMIDSSFLVK
jgi:ABC-type phosphate/phosphonate transport system substrate-binding protein